MRLIDAEHFEQVLNDAINRNPNMNSYVYHAMKIRNCAISECKSLLLEEPTVDCNTPPVHQGRWVEKEATTNDDLTYWWIECSECGERPLKRYGNDVLSDYCPYCGARMHSGAELDEVTENG